MKIFIDKNNLINFPAIANKLVKEESFGNCLDSVVSPDLLGLIGNDAVTLLQESTTNDDDSVLAAPKQPVENIDALMVGIQQSMPPLPILSEQLVENKSSYSELNVSMESIASDRLNVTHQSEQIIERNISECVESSFNTDENGRSQLIDNKYNARNLTAAHQKLTASIPDLLSTDDLNRVPVKTEGESIKLNNVVEKWLGQVNDHDVPSNKAEQNIINSIVANQSTQVGHISQSSEAIVPKRTDLMFTLEKIEQLQNNVAPNNQYHVSIKVAPEELGPITAKIKMDKNRAIIDIMVNNAHVKGVMEANLSALKAQFSQSSIQIESINVQEMPLFQQSQQEQSSSQQHHHDALNGVLNQPGNVKQPIEKSNIKSDGLIDTYI